MTVTDRLASLENALTALKGSAFVKTIYAGTRPKNIFDKIAMLALELGKAEGSNSPARRTPEDQALIDELTRRTGGAGRVTQPDPPKSATAAPLPRPTTADSDDETPVSLPPGYLAVEVARTLRGLPKSAVSTHLQVYQALQARNPTLAGSYYSAHGPELVEEFEVTRLLEAQQAYDAKKQAALPKHLRRK